MLNNPNEWHNIEDEENEQSEPTVEATVQNRPSPNAGKVRIIIFALVIFVAVTIAIVNKTKSTNESVPSYEQNQQQVSSNVGADNFADSNTETVEISVDIPADTPQGTTAQDKLNPNDSVIIAVGGEGRENPFVPYLGMGSNPVSRANYTTAYGGTYRGGYGIPFEVVEPPQKLIRDIKAESLMTTTVSGILYDSKNPSAIVNYKGEDQMVRKGDKLSNFTIIDITKSKVVVKSGSNIYMASVGQSLQDDSDININEMYNLQRKFGGAYASEVPRGILIKPIIKPN